MNLMTVQAWVLQLKLRVLLAGTLKTEKLDSFNLLEDDDRRWGAV